MSLDQLAHDKIAGEPSVTEKDEKTSNPYENVDEQNEKTVSKTVSVSLSVSEEDKRNSRLVGGGIKRLCKVKSDEDKELLDATSEASAPLFGLVREKFGLWGLMGGTFFALGLAWLPRILDVLEEGVE